MEDIVNTYVVKIVRERGENPLTGHSYNYAEETLTIDTTSPQKAHELAQVLTSLRFCGQHMIVFIDGKEHFHEKL